MSNAYSFNRRLAAYRTEKGIKQEDLASAMGFNDRQTLSHIEKCQRSLSVDELMKALKFLELTFDEFSDQYSLIGEASYSWRKKDASAADLTSFEKSTNRLIALYRELDSAYATTKRSVVLPKLSLDKQSTTFEAQEYAEQLVEEFNLGDFPADTLEDNLSNKFEILTLYVDAPKAVSGAAIKLDKLNVILINRTEVIGRRNFDMAHEAFHCLTWDTLPPKHVEVAEKTSNTPKPIEERLADAFASALLMPSNSIEKYFPTDITINEEVINSLADKFRVTSNALLWRLVNLKKISKELRNQLDNSLIVNNGHKSKDKLPIKFNKTYASYIHRSLESGSMSVRKMATTLGLSIDDLADLFEQYHLPAPFEL